MDDSGITTTFTIYTADYDTIREDDFRQRQSELRNLLFGKDDVNGVVSFARAGSDGAFTVSDDIDKAAIRLLLLSVPLLTEGKDYEYLYWSGPAKAALRWQGDEVIAEDALGRSYAFPAAALLPAVVEAGERWVRLLETLCGEEPLSKARALRARALQEQSQTALKKWQAR